MLIAKIGLLLERWEWLVLLALLPAVLIPIPLLPLLLLFLPGLWLGRWWATGHFVPPTPLNGPLAGLLFMVLVSMGVTPDLAFSWPKVAGLVYGVALFYGVVAVTGRSPRHLWLVVGGLWVCGVGTAGLSLVGAQWPNKIPILASLVRPLQSLSLFSEGFSPNEVAGVLLWALWPMVILAAAAWLAWRRERFFGKFALTLLAVAVLVLFLLTQSRSALVGFAAGGGLVLVAIAGRYRWPILGGGLVLLALGLGGLILVPAGGDQEALNTLTGRAEIWSRAWYAILDFPLTGLGMNNFRWVAPLLYPFFLITPGLDIAHAHNHLLQAAVDLGLPGLAAYLAIWGIAGRTLYQKWQTQTDRWLRALHLGLAAGLLAYFVYGLTDAVALGARPGFIFWLLLGLAISNTKQQ